MRSTPRPAPLVAVCTALAAVSAGAANDDVLIVSRPTALFAFATASLLANDAECASIHSYSLPGRGRLEAIGDGWLAYEPADAFAAAGADGFRYLNACGAAATVTLVADLKGHLLLRGPTDAQLDQQQWSVVGDVAVSCPSPPGCRLGVGYSTGMPAFVETPVPYQHGTAHGGNTSVELDPGTGPVPLLPAGLPPSAEVHLFSAIAHSGEPAFEVALAMGTEGPQVIARGRQELAAPPGASPWSGTVTVPLPAGPQRIELNWWLAPEPGLPAGGAILKVAGQTGALVELANHGLEIDRWVFGALAPPPAVDGRAFLADVQIWESPDPPIFPPLLRDDFEWGDLAFGPWSGVSNPDYLAVSTTPTHGARLEITASPSAPAFVADFPPGLQRHYRARFSLVTGTEACPMALAEQPLTVFEALAADGLHGFSVEIRQGSGLEVCATAVLDGGVRTSLPHCAPLSADRTQVALQSWAAADADSRDGGLRLWLEGVAVGEILGLDNSLALVEQALLGATAAPAGAAGTVCLDDFESWR